MRNHREHATKWRIKREKKKNNRGEEIDKGTGSGFQHELQQFRHPERYCCRPFKQNKTQNCFDVSFLPDWKHSVANRLSIDSGLDLMASRMFSKANKYPGFRRPGTAGSGKRGQSIQSSIPIRRRLFRFPNTFSSVRHQTNINSKCFPKSLK